MKFLENHEIINEWSEFFLLLLCGCSETKSQDKVGVVVSLLRPFMDRTWKVIVPYEAAPLVTNIDNSISWIKKFNFYILVNKYHLKKKFKNVKDRQRWAINLPKKVKKMKAHTKNIVLLWYFLCRFRNFG